MAMNEPTAAQKAYKTWKALHKVNLQVYTDEQMFCIGYEMRNELIDEMEELIDVLVNRLTETKKEVKNATKPKPATKRATRSTKSTK